MSVGFTKLLLEASSCPGGCAAVGAPPAGRPHAASPLAASIAYPKDQGASLHRARLFTPAAHDSQRPRGPVSCLINGQLGGPVQPSPDPCDKRPAAPSCRSCRPIARKLDERSW